MKIAIRVDASEEIGTGHLMRCFCLATELISIAEDIRFISYQIPDYFCNLLNESGYSVVKIDYELYSNEYQVRGKISDSVNQKLDSEATLNALSCDEKWDLLIVDHYQLDARWESDLRKVVDKIMVIDDLANRSHDCDVLLDQNFYNNLQTRYVGLVPEHCKCFLGPSYLLLRREFLVEKSKLRARNGSINRVLVFFGGSDPTNETQKVIDAIDLLNASELQFDIVIGAANPRLNNFKSMQFNYENVRFYFQVNNMAELIQKADLAIGAGGSAMWERCYLGIPSIITITAHNQKETTEAVASKHAIFLLGYSDAVEAKDYLRSINLLIRQPRTVREISSAALELVMPTNESAAFNAWIHNI